MFGYVVVYASKEEIPWDKILSKLDIWKIPIGPIVPEGAQMLDVVLTDYDRELLIAKAALLLYDDQKCPRGDTRVPGIFVHSELSLDDLEGQIDRILIHKSV